MGLIFLTGYMGCGKSTLGRRLARRLGCRFVDTDQEIERAEGVSVSDIFRYEGEEAFRRRERGMLERLIAEGGTAVIATGGGLPVWGDNMARMNETGLTVYIRRSPEVIASRLSPYGRAKRPRLSGLNDAELIDFMTRDLAGRAPRYEEARLILDADGHEDPELIEIIVQTASDC